MRNGSRTPTNLKALEALVRTHQERLWLYLRYLGCDAATAEDVVQDTFLEVWRRPFEERSPASTRAYLRRVAKNRFLMAVRRGRAVVAFDALDEADALWATQQEEDDGSRYSEALRHCLERLSDRARQAIDHFYGGNASRRHVAELLGLSVDGVKTLLRRARNALKTCIERQPQ